MQKYSDGYHDGYVVGVEDALEMIEECMLDDAPEGAVATLRALAHSIKETLLDEGMTTVSVP